MGAIPTIKQRVATADDLVRLALRPSDLRSLTDAAQVSGFVVVPDCPGGQIWKSDHLHSVGELKIPFDVLKAGLS